jgi:hypothetical protein
MTKRNEHKIAFTATNCSGKTQTTFDVASRLKKRGYLVEVINSLDRKSLWPDAQFPLTIQAHFGTISRLIAAEVEVGLRGDCDLVLSDRSVLDLFSIAMVDHPNDPLMPALKSLVLGWLTTYSKIYYLQPFKYQHDGKRPANDFRMKTHDSLLNIIKTESLSNVVVIPRENIYKDIQQVLGIEVQVPAFAQVEKWQHLATEHKTNVIVKESVFANSDIDVWLEFGGIRYDLVDRFKKHAEFLFGQSVHVMTTVPNSPLLEGMVCYKSQRI